MEGPQTVSAPVRDLELEMAFIQVVLNGVSLDNATEALQTGTLTLSGASNWQDSTHVVAHGCREGDASCLELS